MRNRWQGRIVILTVLLLAAMALVAIPAGAAPDESSEDIGVETGGYVEGRADGARIVCKWELPDARPYADGMTYGGSLGRAPGGAGFPCSVKEGYVLPEYDPGHTVLSLEALPHDLGDDGIPELPIELWSAVTHDTSIDLIGDVYWKIFHPDQSWKAQDHGERVGRAELERGVGWYEDRYQIDKSQEGSMWYAAVFGTDQVEEDAVEAQNGLVAQAIEQQVAIYKGYFTLHKHQPCGRYAVVNYVVAEDVETQVVNYIYVNCFIDLQLDFKEINWGRMSGGIRTILPGNTIWGDYEPDEARGARNMTVGNGGSGQMQVGLAFAPLVEADEHGPKLITHFDAAFGLNPSKLQVIDPIYSGEEPGKLGERVWFDRSPYQVLCANETGKLDLSVHPPVGIPPNEYYGHMVVYGMGGYIVDDVHVATTDTPPPPPDDGLFCNNNLGRWDGGNQRPSNSSG